MIKAPKRISLVADVTMALREHIASCPVGAKLPGEHEICRHMNVSRPTLRAALATLEREGIVRTRKGCARVVTSTTAPPAPPCSVAHGDVVVISPVARESLESRDLQWLDALRAALGGQAYLLEFMEHPACYTKKPRSALLKLTDRKRARAWILLRSTRAMQAWFTERDLPTVVVGSVYDNMPLPAVDIDHRAACRHAVGLFAAREHRRLCLLLPESSSAGDLESERGFAEARVAAATGALQRVVAHHDGTVAGVCKAVDRLLAARRPPTAFLAARSCHALTALTYLAERGIRCPEQAAFISRDHDTFLDLVVPTVACYRIPAPVFARKLSRLVLDLASGGNPRGRPHLLVPRFRPGMTL